MMKVFVLSALQVCAPNKLFNSHSTLHVARINKIVTCMSSPGPFIHFYKKKVSFAFAIAFSSIGAPDMVKNFAQRSEMENMVF